MVAVAIQTKLAVVLSGLDDGDEDLQMTRGASVYILFPASVIR